MQRLNLVPVGAIVLLRSSGGCVAPYSSGGVWRRQLIVLNKTLRIKAPALYEWVVVEKFPSEKHAKFATGHH